MQTSSASPMTSSSPSTTPAIKEISRLHEACSESLEFMMRRPTTASDGNEPRAWGSLIAAHERLWEIMHPELLMAIKAPTTPASGPSAH